MKISAGALIFYQEELLILKPSYRDYWLFPGGAAEEGEAPLQACMREIEEEIDLILRLDQLLCVDFLPEGTEITGENSHRVTKEDEITFLFRAEDLTQDQFNQLQIDGQEIIDYKFIQPLQARPYLPSYQKKRLPHCLSAIKDRFTIYLENGEVVSPIPRQSD